MTKVTKVSPEKELPGILSGRIEKPTASAAASVAVKEEDVKDALESGTVVIRKRKKLIRYAMLLGYQGKNYYGMQIQTGMQSDLPTIESTLLRAMCEYGIINEEEEKKPSMIFFQRAGRTDRTVSAVRQCCSMFLPLDEDFLNNGPEKINQHLPSDIRVLGVRRAIPSFHAQKSCNARSYSYTLPAYAFADTNELTQSKYRISEQRIKDVDEILAAFTGTHNFYNYTARREHSEASCNRYIVNFKCEKPFLFKDPVRNEEVEFVTVNIKGQSFMLHQIRKMIGMTIAVVRGLSYRSDIQKSFEKYRMDVPKAPGLGLLQERVHYEVHDRKHGQVHGTLDNWGEEVEARAQKVRDELIRPEILKTECETQSMMMWLASLVNHDFMCNPEDETGESKSALSKAVATAKEALNEAETTAELREVKQEAEANVGEVPVPNQELREVKQEAEDNADEAPVQNQAEEVEEKPPMQRQAAAGR